MTQRTVSLGFTRDDGDFQILATLNDNDELLANGQFNRIVASLQRQLQNSLARTSELTILIYERQDAPDYVTLDDTAVAAVAADHEYEIGLYRLLDQQRVIADIWGIDDVRQERPHLTEDQAWHVLQTVEQRLNSEFGINWDFIRDTADELYPEPEEPNSNCLADLACPKCGNSDRLKIAAKTLVSVTDEGAEAVGDMEWDDDSAAECPKCSHRAPLKEFRMQSPEDHPRPA